VKKPRPQVISAGQRPVVAAPPASEPECER
jgi:hypothetical protein